VAAEKDHVDRGEGTPSAFAGIPSAFNEIYRFLVSRFIIGLE